MMSTASTMSTANTQPAETQLASSAPSGAMELEPAALEPVQAAESQAVEPRAVEAEESVEAEETADTMPRLAPLYGEAQPGESNQAIIACNDWLRLGPGRTLGRLIAFYEAQDSPAATDQNRPIPTKTDRNQPKLTKNGTLALPSVRPSLSRGTLKEWSARFNWRHRAVMFDSQYEEERNARRREVLEEGYALEFERLTVLKQSAAALYAHLFEQSEVAGEADTGDDTRPVSITGAPSRRYHNLWVPDVKTVGSGPTAERFYFERFNSELVAQFRGLLDDIAKETGGRHRNSHLDAWLRDQLPKVNMSKLSPRQIDQLANGEHLLTVLLESYFEAAD